MAGTTKPKFNKQEATLWLLTGCLGIGIGVGLRFANITPATTVATVSQTLSNQVSASSRQLSTSSPSISVFRQPVFRSVGRTRGS